MSPEDLRPILSGLAGAAVAGWLTDRPVAEAFAVDSLSQRLPVAMTSAIEIPG